MTHTKAEQAIKRAGSCLKLGIHRKESPPAAAVVEKKPPKPTAAVPERILETQSENVTPDDNVVSVKPRRMSSNVRPPETVTKVPDKVKDPDWYKSMMKNFHTSQPEEKPKLPKVLKKASVYEQEVEKMNQYNAERSRPLQRSDSKSIAEGVRRSQSPGGPAPQAPKRNTSNGVVPNRQSSLSPDPIRRPPPPTRNPFSPQAGKKGIGFKPGGTSLAAGVKGARNISEAPLMHVSNIDHHERVSSYDSVESNTSNASFGARSSEMSTPRSNSPHQFVGPISTKPITQPYNSRAPPKHNLHIDSSSRDVPSYNSQEVANMLRQSYTARTESVLEDNTMDFIKEFKDSKVIPLNKLRDNENKVEVDAKIPESKNITIATPTPTTTAAPRDTSRDTMTTPRDTSRDVRAAREEPAKEEPAPRYCKARYTFKAEGPRELSFKKKDVIRIRREVDANWIEGELNDTVGIFPRNYVDILDPEPSPQEVETTFESKTPTSPDTAPSGLSYVPSYQRDLGNLPQLSRYKKAEDEADKENRREQERKRAEEKRKEEERREKERQEQEAERQRLLEQRLEEERRKVREQRAAEQKKREEEKRREEERMIRELEEERLRLIEEERLEEERLKREEEERVRREEEERKIREEADRRRREEDRRRREEERERKRKEEEELRRIQERIRREEEERIRLEEKERLRREEEKRQRELERQRKEEEEIKRIEAEERRREEDRKKRDEEDRKRQEERQKRLEAERLREEQLAREEEERLREEKRKREEERMQELDRLHQQTMDEGRRLKEEADERARVKEQNNINHRVSNSELGDDTFEVKAIYSFKSTEDGELPFRKGAVITVTEVVDDNWFYGQLGAAQGIFPTSYVIKVEPEEPVLPPVAQRIEDCLEELSSPEKDEPEVDGIHDTSGNHDNRSAEDSDDSNFQDYELYLAQYSYQPLNADELELQRGDIVEVIERCDDGWYVGSSQRTGQFGTFPGNYVLPYDE